MQNKDLVNKLFELGAHFGHRSSKFHPDMAPYVWGVKNGMHLIDLNKTAFLIEHACNQIEEVLAQGGQVLWVGTKKQAQKSILEAATVLSQPYVIHRWIGGTLTNSDQVKKAVTRLLHMRDVIAKPIGNVKKKQISMLRKDLDRLEKNVSGIVGLRGKPAVLIVVDVKREATAIKEAKRCNIPVIALVDTNAPAELVDVVIPANDDSQKSIGFIIHKLMEAANKGIQRAVVNKKNVVEESTQTGHGEKKAIKNRPVNHNNNRDGGNSENKGPRYNSGKPRTGAYKPRRPVANKDNKTE